MPTSFSRRLRTSSLLVLWLVGVGAVLLLKVLQVEVPDVSLGKLGGNSVVLTSEGFFPRQLTVQQGEVVTFSTIDNQPFWPASNLHPSHTIYPEFDPERELNPSETWWFVFEKPGTWVYHDHLRPAYTGVIRVVVDDATSGNKLTNQDILEACFETGPGQSVGDGGKFGSTDKRTSEESTNQTKLEQIECLAQHLSATTQNQGLQPALDQLYTFYDQFPSIRPNCHDLAHVIGRELYYAYANEEDLSLPASAGVCGFGLYHGLMETLMTIEGDVLVARDFCLQLRDGTQDVVLSDQQYSSCFHGIGHGTFDIFVVTEDLDAETINQGLALCDKVSETEWEKWQCVSGVYNSLRISIKVYQEHRPLQNQDPLQICRTQPEEYQPLCYGDLLNEYADYKGLGLSESWSFFSEKYGSDVSQETIDQVVNYLGARQARLYSRDGIETDTMVVTECRELGASSTQLDCVMGYLDGIFMAYFPDELPDRVLQVCVEQDLTKQERQECFQRLISFSAITGDQAWTDRSCALVASSGGGTEFAHCSEASDNR